MISELKDIFGSKALWKTEVQKNRVLVIFLQRFCLFSDVWVGRETPNGLYIAVLYWIGYTSYQQPLLVFIFFFHRPNFLLFMVFWDLYVFRKGWFAKLGNQSCFCASVAEKLLLKWSHLQKHKKTTTNVQIIVIPLTAYINYS